jgi:hypothetical protein
VGVVGGVDFDGFCSFDEQPTIVTVSSAVNSATRWAYLRMPTNLCNASAPFLRRAAGDPFAQLAGSSLGGVIIDTYGK